MTTRQGMKQRSLFFPFCVTDAAVPEIQGRILRSPCQIIAYMVDLPALLGKFLDLMHALPQMLPFD